MPRPRKHSTPPSKASSEPEAKHEAKPLPPLDELQRYSVPEALAYLRTSRQAFYNLVAAGGIKTITQGKRRYVPGREIARLSQ